MENFLDISRYTIYKLRTDEDLLVAVPNAYHEQITQLVKEYGSLEKIPASKTVRGIFIKNDPAQKRAPEMLTATEQENDITVNQLILLA